jgi:UPF0176 protein
VFLHNRINNRELKHRLTVGPADFSTLSFYRYLRLADPATYRAKLYADFTAMGVRGRVYVATEGINAQVSVPNDQVERFREYVAQAAELRGIRLNWAVDDNGKSFFKLKITVRKKIVADGLDDSTFDVTNAAPHLNAEEFNRITDDPSTVVVDMRNHYESEIGHFRNALCPDADTFRDALPLADALLSDKKDRTIVLYCTGGIRCEKAGAWFRHKGYAHVYQLGGGIIEYTRQAKSKGLENKFIGKNFVFDERLGERISADVVSQCHQCGKPCDTHTNCRNDGCHLLFIQCVECAQKYAGCCSINCGEVIALPADAQKAMRSGKAQSRKVYRKGRTFQKSEAG